MAGVNRVEFPENYTHFFIVFVRHMLGAFQNCKGARQWRRYLSENAFKQGAGIEVVETALSFVETN
jgi:hypothetical protein